MSAYSDFKPRVRRLSPRQRALVQPIREGASDRELALGFGLTEGTVRSYRSLIRKAMGVQCRRSTRQQQIREQQISFGICCGMTQLQMARALGLHEGTVSERVKRLFDKTGMHNRVEFALTQNAAVRELVHG